MKKKFINVGDELSVEAKVLFKESSTGIVTLIKEGQIVGVFLGRFPKELLENIKHKLAVVVSQLNYVDKVYHLKKNDSIILRSFEVFFKNNFTEIMKEISRLFQNGASLEDIERYIYRVNMFDEDKKIIIKEIVRVFNKLQIADLSA